MDIILKFFTSIARKIQQYYQGNKQKASEIVYDFDAFLIKYFLVKQNCNTRVLSDQRAVAN